MRPDQKYMPDFARHDNYSDFDTDIDFNNESENEKGNADKAETDDINLVPFKTQLPYNVLATGWIPVFIFDNSKNPDNVSANMSAIIPNSPMGTLSPFGPQFAMPNLSNLGGNTLGAQNLAYPYTPMGATAPGNQFTSPYYPATNVPGLTYGYNPWSTMGASPAGMTAMGTPTGFGGATPPNTMPGSPMSGFPDEFGNTANNPNMGTFPGNMTGTTPYGGFPGATPYSMTGSPTGDFVDEFGETTGGNTMGYAPGGMTGNPSVGPSGSFSGNFTGTMMGGFPGGFGGTSPGSMMGGFPGGSGSTSPGSMMGGFPGGTSAGFGGNATGSSMTGGTGMTGGTTGTGTTGSTPGGFGGTTGTGTTGGTSGGFGATTGTGMTAGTGTTGGTSGGFGSTTGTGTTAGTSGGFGGTTGTGTTGGTSGGFGSTTGTGTTGGASGGFGSSNTISTTLDDDLIPYNINSINYLNPRLDNDITEIIKNFDLDLDEDMDLSRVNSDKRIDAIFSNITQKHDEIISLLRAYNIPFPIAKLLIRKIIKLSLVHGKRVDEE